MIIAVNTRLLLKNKLDGIGWFTYQTLKRITQNHPEHQFVFLFDRNYDPDFIFGSNVKAFVVSPPARHPLLWYWWFEKRIPAVLSKVKADIFVSPDGFIPLSIEIPSVPVIHDINFHHRPGDLPLSSRIYYRHFFPRFAKKARRIVTVSEYSKSDIEQSYHIDSSKIDVVYNGAHELYKPLNEIEKQKVKMNYANGADYFVFVGSLHPRKNVEGLLRGYDEFRSSRQSLFKLLIVGEKFFLNSDLEKTYSDMRFKSDVIFAGRKEPEELSKIVGAAWAMAFVPHFEGFGIPLLEAMHCNVPSVASRVTSLPEVAGDTAIYVDPSDIHSISDGLKKMAFETIIRDELIQNCEKQRLKFSWDQTAEKFWSSIEKIF